MNYLVNAISFTKFTELFWILYFIILWFEPNLIIKIDPEAPNVLASQLFLEFIFAHALTMFYVLLLIFKNNIGKILVVTLFFSFYGFFFYHLTTLGALIPIAIFCISLLAKLRRSYLNVNEQTYERDLALEIAHSIVRLQIFAISFFIGFGVPWPKFGIRNIHFINPNNGQSLEQAENAIAFCIFYYLVLMIYENMASMKVRNSLKPLMTKFFKK